MGRQNGHQAPREDDKALEARALAFLKAGALNGPQVAGVGDVTAMTDAASRRYAHERDLRALQTEFNAFTIGMKDGDGASQVVARAKRTLALIEQIDAEFPGDLEHNLPSAREYMEKVIRPKMERRLLEALLADMESEVGTMTIPPVDRKIAVEIEAGV